MMNILHQVEIELPRLLLEREHWNSLLIDYSAPTVERLWRDWDGYRIALHRIHPCTPKQALFHPHPWPSAMRVVSGMYEMSIGYGVGYMLPSIAATIMIPAGSAYEMTDPNGWHSVRPIGQPTLSLMITGKPWGRESPKGDTPLLPLPKSLADELFRAFCEHYPLIDA